MAWSYTPGSPGSLISTGATEGSPDFILAGIDYLISQDPTKGTRSGLSGTITDVRIEAPQPGSWLIFNENSVVEFFGSAGWERFYGGIEFEPNCQLIYSHSTPNNPGLWCHTFRVKRNGFYGTKVRFTYNSTSQQTWPAPGVNVSNDLLIDGLEIYGVPGNSNSGTHAFNVGDLSSVSVKDLEVIGEGHGVTFNGETSGFITTSLSLAGQGGTERTTRISDSTFIPLSSGTSRFGGLQRDTNYEYVNPTFLGDFGWNGGAIDLSSTVGTYLSVLFDFTLSVRSLGVAVEGANYRFSSAVVSTTGTPLWPAPAHRELTGQTDASGSLSVQLVDGYRERVSGDSNSDFERYDWTLKVRKYDQKTGLDAIFSSRVLQQNFVNQAGGFNETAEMVPVGGLVLTEAAAGTLTGVALDGPNKRATITAARTAQEVWQYYRQWIVQLANFDVVDAWDYVSGTTLDPADWFLNVESVVPSGPVAIGAQATVEVDGGTTDLTNFSFVAGSTIDNVSADDATVLVSNDPGIVATSTGGGAITVTAPVVAFNAPNFEDGVRATGDHVQLFTLDASTAVDTTNNTITLSVDSNGDAPAFAASQPYTLVRLLEPSGSTLPNSAANEIRPWTAERGGGLYFATISGTDVQLFTSFANIPSTPVDFDSTGSGTFILRAETPLFNTVVTGGNGLSEQLSLNDGAQLRLRACQWDNTGGNATSTTFFDNRDNLLSWSSTAGISVAVELGLGFETLETVHEEIIDATFARSRKFGELATTNDGSLMDSSNGGPFSISLEGLGRINVNTNDPDGKELIQNAFAWYCWARYQAGAISIISLDTFTATNFFDYAGKNLAIDNLAAEPFLFAGGSVSISGTATGVAEGSGSVYLNVDVVGTGALLEGSGSSVTANAVADAVLQEVVTDHSATPNSLAAYVARVDGLIEDSSGDRFTSKALEASPTDVGLDAAGVRAAVGLASANLDTQLGNVPTNPVLTTDSRLDNLDTTISSRSSHSASDVEAALINEGDGQTLINTIIQAINSSLDLPATELVAIATSVRNELAPLESQLDEIYSRHALKSGVSVSTVRVDDTTTETFDGITITHVVDEDNDTIVSTRS